MMKCPNCGTEIWVGSPMIAEQVRVGDRIKVTIEEGDGVVILSHPKRPGIVELRTRRADGQEFDHYLGTDHTVWLVKRG